MTQITTPRHRRTAAVAQLDLVELIEQMERQAAAATGRRYGPMEQIEVKQ